jgi:hypothetical protein
MRRYLLLSMLAVGLAACGTTQMSMPYSPAAQPVSVNRPVVAMGTVTDRREDGREDANWIGTVRGSFGNPVKRLEAPVPVSEIVRQAFSDALAARGMLATGAPRYLLSVEILQFKSDQVGRREATVEFQVTLTPSGGGAVVLQDRELANQITGSVLTLSAGVFGSLDELRAIALSTMSQAIDRILDKPGFAAALR